MFSRMNRVNDCRNRLSRKQLEHNLCTREDGPMNKYFDPETPLVDGIMKKFGELLPQNRTTIQRSAEN